MKYLFPIFQMERHRTQVLIVLLILLVVIFVVVMSSENPEWIFNLLGIAENGESKYEALKFLGIGMGGVLVALQALMSYKRAKAMEDTAQAQADAVLKTEQGQRQDRLKNAIEHLGHKSDSVRLGGAYELFHLAQDTEDLRQTVLDILCAHIRRTTSKSKYWEKHNLEPSEEIQSLLTLLFVQEHEVFKGCHINLQGSRLNGAYLKKARLAKASLNSARLQGATLNNARLQGATLDWAQMQGAFLIDTKLQGATLIDTKLQGAILKSARLQGTTLNKTQMQGALLAEAQLQGASLVETQLQAANLVETQLQGAMLFLGIQLQGAALQRAQLQGIGSVDGSSMSFQDRIREQIDKESDLSEVIFAGGLNQESVESLVEGLSHQATRVRAKLRPHIDKPEGYKLPEDSGAITGSYTEQEAKQWIAEYEQAMSELPGNDS